MEGGRKLTPAANEVYALSAPRRGEGKNQLKRLSQCSRVGARGG